MNNIWEESLQLTDLDLYYKERSRNLDLGLNELIRGRTTILWMKFQEIRILNKKNKKK